MLAKEPVPGRAKTRLCPPCTPQSAAALAAAALADTLAAGCASAADRVVLALDGRPGDWCPPGVMIVDQGPGSLADRLATAWTHTEGPAVVIGMDTPQVGPAALDAAYGALVEPGTDAVLGPATDGGWWALGLRRPVPGVFAGIPTSRSDTGARQAARLAALGLAVGALDLRTDVDTWDDAVAVAREAPATRFRHRRPVPRLASGMTGASSVALGRRPPLPTVGQRPWRRHRPARRPVAVRTRPRRASAPRDARGPGARRRVRATAHRGRPRGRGPARAGCGPERHGDRRGTPPPGAGAAPLGLRPSAGRGSMGHGAPAGRQHRHRWRPRAVAAAGCHAAGARRRGRRRRRPAGPALPAPDGQGRVAGGTRGPVVPVGPPRCRPLPAGRGPRRPADGRARRPHRSADRWMARPSWGIGDPVRGLGTDGCDAARARAGHEGRRLAGRRARGSRSGCASRPGSGPIWRRIRRRGSRTLPARPGCTGSPRGCTSRAALLRSRSCWPSCGPCTRGWWSGPRRARPSTRSNGWHCCRWSVVPCSSSCRGRRTSPPGTRGGSSFPGPTSGPRGSPSGRSWSTSAPRRRRPGPRCAERDGRRPARPARPGGPTTLAIAGPSSPVPRWPPPPAQRSVAHRRPGEAPGRSRQQDRRGRRRRRGRDRPGLPPGRRRRRRPGATGPLPRRPAGPPAPRGHVADRVRRGLERVCPVARRPGPRPPRPGGGGALRPRGRRVAAADRALPDVRARSAPGPRSRHAAGAGPRGRAAGARSRLPGPAHRPEPARRAADQVGGRCLVVG